MSGDVTSSMARDEQALQFLDEGKVLVFPCVEILALSNVPKNVGSRGYVRFYEAFDRRYGERLRHYRLNDSTKWKKFTPRDRGKLASWFSDARSLSAALLGITIHAHEPAGEPEPPLFRMFFEQVWPGCPRGMFRVVLPFEASDEPQALLALVDDAMTEFPVHWGTAGFSFYWKSTDPKIDRCAEQWLGRHLLRRPGLAMGNDLLLAAFVEKGVANVGWLTFIGDALVDKLGGQTSVSLAASRVGVGVRVYDRGIALQAGSRPELGDVNGRDDLPLYREVGRLLQPVFAPSEALERISVTGIKDPDQRLEWLRRFLP